MPACEGNDFEKCPFCGSPAYVAAHTDEHSLVEFHMVTCSASVTPGMADVCKVWPETDWHMERDVARIAWNAKAFCNVNPAETFVATEMLCQNCLRVRPYTQAGMEGVERCICGGEFCGCCTCHDAILQLRAGKRKAQDVGTNSDVEKWSPEDGLE